MNQFIENIDATPEKRSFFAIINDYDIQMAISELVDNSIDYWKTSDSTHELCIKIDLDSRQQVITIEDNAGGVKTEDMRLLVSPGASSNSEYNESIGIFGVGSKRAIVALAQDVKIYSHHVQSEDTCVIEFDDSWLEQESWELPLRRANTPIPAGVTKIQLQRLRKTIKGAVWDKEMQAFIGGDTVTHLKRHLSETYGKIITEYDIKIILNGEEVFPLLFSDDWAYPPGLAPKKVVLRFKVEDERVINVHMTGGLLQEGAAADGEHGVYMYCNYRLITRAHRSPQVGYITGQAGSPDHLNIIRVLIEMYGPAKYMPWDSSKTQINFNSDVLQTIQKKIIEVVSHWTKLSRSLEKDGQWRESVFPYTEGSIENIELDIEEKSIHKYLPPIPISRPRYIDRVRSSNREVSKNKPWTVGISESMVAFDAISKLNLQQKNRLLLIILDSTIEISFKEFLVNDSGEFYPDKELLRIFGQRHLVVNEVKKFVDLPETVWKALGYFNGIRNKLIHERASVGLSDHDIAVFKENVEATLSALFDLKFS